MPVVNQDGRDPASWWKPRISYGVIKDGETLRFSRVTRSGQREAFACAIPEWQQSPDFRLRMEKDRQAGAALVAGLEPHRVMLRSLESPLRDKSKSAEIWGTLLDAALPFSLEKCQFCFLPLQSDANEGRRALAVAARMEDLETALAEWQELGLDPDLMVPEPLMISADRVSRRWLGGTRSVFAVWQGDRYIGGGGSLKAAQRDIAFTRFCQSLPDAESIDWRETGPGSESDPADLEQALAGVALHSGSLHANLRANEIMAPPLLKRYAQKQKNLKVALLLVLLMLFLFPLTLRHQLRAYQNLLRSQIATVYTDLTGSPGNAPGQELLLARRYMEDNWGELRKAVTTLSGPTVANTLVEIALQSAAEDLVFSHLEIAAGKLQLHVLGDEVKVKSFCEHLRISGWQIQYEAGSNGAWHIFGEFL